MRGERGRQAVEGGLAAELRVERVVVGHVVAVRAARPALEAGRKIRVADPERLQVGDERGHSIESERRPELEPIGRAPRAPEPRHRLRKD